MAIGKKPKNRQVDEDQLDILIAKGGTSPGEQPPETTGDKQKNKPTKSEIQNVPLRMPADLLSDIDEQISRKIPKPSRNYWIMEAIIEKLERERGK